MNVWNWSLPVGPGCVFRYRLTTGYGDGSNMRQPVELVGQFHSVILVWSKHPQDLMPCTATCRQAFRPAISPGR